MKKQTRNKLIGTLISVFILFIAIFIFLGLMNSRKAIQKSQPKIGQAHPVDVLKVMPKDYEISIQAWGVVKPAVDINLIPQVEGEVVKVSPDMIPGGFFKKGDFIFEINPIDYQLIVEQKESELMVAQADLQIESGNQHIAVEELELMHQKLTTDEQDLVLRKPQLRKVQADIKVAEASLDDAKLNLERTKIYSPFDALVMEESVDLGAQVSAQSSVGRLVGTDYYWVEVAIPLNKLRWIDIGPEETDDNVILTYPGIWDKDQTRKGLVVRLLGNLTETGRMVKLLVKVEDPFSLKPVNQSQPKLLIDEYLQAEIKGKVLRNVVQLKRQYVHDNNQVWLYENGSLRLKEINVTYDDQSYIYASNLKPNDLIITSELSIADDGMAVELSNTLLTTHTR